MNLQILDRVVFGAWTGPPRPYYCMSLPLRFPLGRSHMQLPRILVVPLGGSKHVTSRRRLSHDGFPHMSEGRDRNVLPAYVWYDSEPGWIGAVSKSSSCTHRAFAYTARIVKLVAVGLGISRKLLVSRYHRLPTTWKPHSLFEQG